MLGSKAGGTRVQTFEIGNLADTLSLAKLRNALGKFVTLLVDFGGAIGTNLLLQVLFHIVCLLLPKFGVELKALKTKF